VGTRLDRVRRRPLGSVLNLDSELFRGRAHVRVDGPPGAEPLLLLHGFMGSLHWYDLLVPLLLPQYQVIRVDLLGHGATGGLPADAPRQADMVQAVLEHLDLAGVTAVGHSFGADVAVELAERTPRVTRLAIIAQAPDYSDATFPPSVDLMTRRVLGPALAYSIKGLAGAMSGVAALWPGRLAGGQLVLQGLLDVRALHAGMVPIVLVERRARMAARPLDAQVVAAGKPTIAILGDRDHFYGARSAGRYLAAGARVEVLVGCGHSPFVEQPAQAAALLLDFLAAREQIA
jgi:pimeloyl-ACP methyl ester carboxylesterase